MTMSTEDGGYSTLEPTSVFFRPVCPADIAAVAALEAASYPADEAATPEKLQYRCSHAGDVFMVAVCSGVAAPVAYVPSGAPASPADADAAPTTSAPAADEIVGFVCGTRTASPRLTHHSMSEHDPAGTLLCVHSVVIDARLRRRGLARRMLRAYLQYVAAAAEPPPLHAVHLISKADLAPLYEAVGFHSLGPSEVVHGQDPWMELAFELASPFFEDAEAAAVVV